MRFLSQLVDHVAAEAMLQAFRDRNVVLDAQAVRRHCRALPCSPAALYGQAVEPFDWSAAMGATYPVGNQNWTVIEYDSPAPSGFPSNDKVRAHWVPPFLGEGAERRPVLVVVHGYRQRSFRVFFPPLLRSLHGAGWGGALFELPYHFSRRVPGQQSGEGLVNADPRQTLRAVSQGVMDLRRLIASLRAAGAKDVGVLGISLGGLFAALLGLVEPDLNHLILAEPVADPVDAVWHCRLLRDKRNAALAAGLWQDDLRELLHAVTPTAHLPATAPENMLLFQTKYDQIVRPEAMEALARRWGIKHHRIVSMGHFVFAALAWRVFDDVTGFLQRPAAEAGHD
jgi:esterase/lipase